jgi:GDPmannose 4,6-dehydratase
MLKFKILIIGITSQDGYNMLHYLLNTHGFENYELYGTFHTESNINKNDKIYNNVTLAYLDLLNVNSIHDVIKNIMPDFCFNFASAQPQYENNAINMFCANTMSTLYILDFLQKYKKDCKYLSCGSCWEFGQNINGYFDLTSQCNPSSIYGISKLSNRHIIDYYRNTHNMFVVHVVLFNHDSSKRSDFFLCKKIINHFKNVYNNESIDPFVCENIDAEKDWSDSRDFVRAFWNMLNSTISNNYILSSGKSHKILEIVEIIYKNLNINNIDIVDNEQEYKIYTNKKLIFIGKHCTNSPIMIGNNSHTQNLLNWKPEISFEQMILDMLT